MTTDIREVLWGDWDRRTFTSLALLFAVVCAIYMFVIHAMNLNTEVIRDRFDDANTLFEGRIPSTEYPPLSLVLIAIPRLFASSAWGYNTAYVAMMYVFIVAGLLVSWRTATVLRFSRKHAMLAYSVFMVLMIEFALDRFDMVVMVVTMGAVLMLLEDRPHWAMLLLVAGTLLKVYPGIFFPVFLVYIWRNRSLGMMFRSLAVYVGTGAVAVLVCVLIDPEMVTGFIGYNSGRPLQIECVVASVIYPFGALGWTDVWIQASTAEGSFLSDNLRGSLPDAVADYMVPLLVVLTVAVWLSYAYISREGHDIRLFALVCSACLLLFLSVNKVYSSQYAIWLIGPILLVAMVCGKRSSKALCRVLIVLLLLIQADFAYNVGYLGGGESINNLGMLIIFAKNVITVGLFVLALREIFRYPGSPLKTAVYCKE